MHVTCQILHISSADQISQGALDSNVTVPEIEWKYILFFFSIISNDNLNDTQMFGTTKNRNIIAALEPRGILIWKGYFTIIKVSWSPDILVFKLVPCFNIKTNCTAIGISHYKDRTVVIYSHLNNSYTARWSFQIATPPHPPHTPPTLTPTPTTHIVETHMTHYL